jgi:hypothetical protein
MTDKRLTAFVFFFLLDETVQSAHALINVSINSAFRAIIGKLQQAMNPIQNAVIKERIINSSSKYP